MYRTRKVAVVVPAFNEQAHISSTLSGIPAFVDVVYVVDDASTDSTADSVRQFATRNPEPANPAHRARPQLATRNSLTGATPVVLIRQAVNLGVGAAIATGYERAVRDGMDIAVVMAGDNQMDPAELTRLLDPIVDGRADYTKGDRTSCREHLVGMSPWRRFGNRLLRWLTCIAVGNTQVKDPQNGYTAASRELLTMLPLARLYPRYGYCNQLLAWVSAQHKRLVEVPMPSRYLGEKSKIRYRTYIPKLLWLLTRLTAARLGRRHSADCRRPDAAASVAARRTGASFHVSSPAPGGCAPEFILVEDVRSRE